MVIMWIGSVVLIVIAAFVVIARRSKGNAGINSHDVKEKLKQGATTIDVRTPAEYRSGHYTGARNIPLQELQDRLAEIGDRNKAVVIYCASGMRSAKAAQLLTTAGFTDVTNAGGLSNLPQ